MPYMTYCVQAWGNVYQTSTGPLIKLQKRAIIIIKSNAGYRDSMNQLFFESCTFKFLDLVRLKRLELMFKNKSFPECIQLFLS